MFTRPGTVPGNLTNRLMGRLGATFTLSSCRWSDCQEPGLFPEKLKVKIAAISPGIMVDRSMMYISIVTRLINQFMTVGGTKS